MHYGFVGLSFGQSSNGSSNCIHINVMLCGRRIQSETGTLASPERILNNI